MRIPARSALTAAAIGAALAGCRDSSPPQRGTETPAPVETAPPPRVAPTGRVEVAPVTFAGLDAAIKEHMGKVVLVDVWSLG
jgi:hypothetical protein